jgi:type IV pilus assembly protein PilY1
MAAAVAALGAFGAARLAGAQQIDVNPPVPNVMLLIDNSGSMERMIDGTLPENTPANACNCDPNAYTCNAPAPAAANRWGTLQQALTGQLANGYNCVAMPRTPNSTFSTEYQINTRPPYDVSYYLPFHRMVALDNSSGTTIPCVISPGTLPGAPQGAGVGYHGNGTGPTISADSFVAGDILPLQLGQLQNPVSCQFSQLTNGAIDSMTQLMRFGLMMFDVDPLPNIGVTVSGSNYSVASDPFTGMWSYYPGWNTGQSCPYQGFPAGCKSGPTTMAVGARNPAAPPWEGRMVRFPATGDITSQEQNNSNLQNVILASRPYGATPLAGMLTGAEYYFWNDPSGPQQTDPFVQGDCRPEFIIIMTDGVPNDDMRPYCESGDGGVGQCPFDTSGPGSGLPENITKTLYNNGVPANGNYQSVKTYVIGFAVSSFDDSGSTVYCSTLVNNGQLSNVCASASTTSQYGPCCELQKIAVYGGSSHAYFADTPGDLQQALGAILGDISSQSTTRTTPAYSPVVGNASNPTSPIQEVFYASFTPSAGGPWYGDIQRVVTTCQAASASSSSSSASASASSSSSSSSSGGYNQSNGDDLGYDLNNNASSRTFIVYEPSTPSAAAGSIRPFVSASVTDGVASTSATMYAGSASTLIGGGQISPTALGIAAAGCPYTPNNATGTAYLDPNTCRNMVLDFEFGQPATAFTGPSNFTFQPRSPSVLGDIYHASPIVVGPPGSLIQDPTYESFRNLCATGNCGTAPATSCTSSASSASGSGQQRPTVVYAATNDGLLHAFWADVPCPQTNSELWAMLLPAAMPNLLSTYPASHQFLLDGSPVVKDVVWDRSPSNDTATETVTNSQGLWHTMLVAGFGAEQRGYYAVDVTNTATSVLANGAPVSAAAAPALGPTLRWQLTTIPGSFQIFGQYSGKPALTTLAMDPNGSGTVQEIGVAILPGGWDGPPQTATECTRDSNQLSTQPLAGYVKRPSVRCWGATQNSNAGVNGRALTIVRLDTGEILRVFARKSDFPTTGSTIDLTRVIDSPLDSPLTGTPMVYPNDVGADTTKIFVSDADGTIWRFDVSNTDPTKWTAPSIFLDLYNQTVDTDTTNSWNEGQPVQVDPVLSLDSGGRLVMNVATGTTDTFDSSGIYYVYSITEQPSTTGVNSFVNWYFGAQSAPSALRQGERVAGPMTVFNGELYFATYYAGSPTTVSCTSGDARIWGMDFETPYTPPASSTTTTTTTTCTNNPDPCRQNGGVYSIDIDPAQTLGYIDVGTANPGRVVPGVALQATPACGSFTQTTDPYTGGTHELLGALQSQPSFQIVGMIGGVSAGAAGLPATKTVQVTMPLSPTVIDSWAAVLE